jgi:hypothetical protein
VIGLLLFLYIAFGAAFVVSAWQSIRKHSALIFLGVLLGWPLITAILISAGALMVTLYILVNCLERFEEGWSR